MSERGSTADTTCEERDGKSALPRLAARDAASGMLRTDEIHKLILKLRWIGADDLAELLCQYLRTAAPSNFVRIAPGGTDEVFVAGENR